MIFTKGVLQSVAQRELGQIPFLSHSFKEEPNLGTRETMEDYTIVEPNLLLDGRYAFYAVLDGHGGHQVAEYVALQFPNLLKTNLRAYRTSKDIESIFLMCLDSIEEDLINMEFNQVGSTFCALLIDRVSKEMTVINIGDSGILQVACENDGMLSAGFLSVPHKTNDFEEVRRIMMSGGIVFNGRVGGVLMMTRAIGDFELKKFGVISDPDFCKFCIDTSSLLILASDGVWDFLKIDDVLNMLMENPDVTCEMLSEIITSEAIKKGSLDNISVICVVVN